MPKIKIKDLVIILPGITGSVLQKNGRDLWAVSSQAIVQGLFSGGASLQQLKLDHDDPDVDDLGDGIQATSLIQDVHMVPGLSKIDGYTGMRRLFTEQFEVVTGDLHSDRPANYFEFPYDWRRDNRAIARQLQQLVATRLPRWRDFSGAQDARVILVAHSMGGLISRYYLEVLGGWRDCRTLLTFGTPHRGSVNALGFLANGYKQLFIDLTAVLRSCTSVYQLLPIYPMLTVESTNQDQRVAEVNSIPNVDQARAQAALQFHRDIEKAEQSNQSNPDYLQHGYFQTPIVGVSQPTFQSALLSGGKLTLLRDRPAIVPESMVDGDGTVPRVSAIPLAQSERFRGFFAAEQHGSLQNNTTLLDQLYQWMVQLQAPDLSNIRDLAPAGPPQERAALGLELDDLYTAAQPVTLQATLLNTTQDFGGVIATIRARSSRRRARKVKLQPAQGNHWHATVLTLPPAIYELTLATARADPGAPEPVHGLFAVV